MSSIFPRVTLKRCEKLPITQKNLTTSVRKNCGEKPHLCSSLKVPYGTLGIKVPLVLSRGFPGGSDGKASAYNAGETQVQSLGQEDSPGEGNGNPL